MPPRVVLVLVGFVSLLSGCGPNAGPTGPITRPTVTPVTPAQTPTPTVNLVVGAWTGTASACYGTTIWHLNQSGQAFDMSATFYTDSSQTKWDAHGTIVGTTSLRGTFDDGYSDYWGNGCGDSGDFEGSILSPNSLTIRVRMLAADSPYPGCGCAGPVSISFSR